MVSFARFISVLTFFSFDDDVYPTELSTFTPAVALERIVFAFSRVEVQSENENAFLPKGPAEPRPHFKLRHPHRINGQHTRTSLIEATQQHSRRRNQINRRRWLIGPPITYRTPARPPIRSPLTSLRSLNLAPNQPSTNTRILNHPIDLRTPRREPPLAHSTLGQAEQAHNQPTHQRTPPTHLPAYQPILIKTKTTRLTRFSHRFGRSPCVGEDCGEAGFTWSSVFARGV